MTDPATGDRLPPRDEPDTSGDERWMTAASPAAPPPRRSQAGRAGFDLTAAPGSLFNLVRGVWDSRELVSMLARKNFFVRYRRASFGVAWAVGIPLIQSSVLALVFSRVVKIETGSSYVAFLFTGQLCWQFIAASVTAGSTAIVDGTALSARIYFPRVVHVLTNVVVSLYTLGISAVIVLLTCLAFGVSLGAEVLLLIPAILLMAVFVVALTMFTAALHVYFRDIRFIVTAMLQAWFYLTPVLYPLDFAPDALRALITANPATGLVLLFRSSTVGAEVSLVVPLLVTLAWTVGIGIAALELHRRYDRDFVDLL